MYVRELEHVTTDHHFPFGQIQPTVVKALMVLAKSRNVSAAVVSAYFGRPCLGKALLPGLAAGLNPLNPPPQYLTSSCSEIGETSDGIFKASLINPL